MARKEANFEEDIIDLTELIESGARGDGRAAPPRAEAGEEEDFAAILAETGGVPPHDVDPNEVLDMSGMGGIDNLLESLDIPSQAEAPEKAASAPPGPDDLDNVLDDLLGEPAPASAPAKSSSIDDDLDSLLAEPAPVPPGRQAKAAPSIEDDLDALLGEAPAKSQAAPARASASADEADSLLNEAPDAGRPAPAPASSIEDDLDALLGEIDQPAKPAPAPAKPAQKMDDDPDDLLSSLDEAPASKPAPAPQASPTPDETSLAADLDDILGEVELPTPPPPPPAPEPEPAAAAPDLAEELSLLDDQGETGIESPAEVDSLLEAAAASAQPGPAKVAGVPSTLPAGTEPALLPALTPETLAGLCRNLAGLDGTLQQTLQDFSRELGEQTAHLQDTVGQVDQLARRLLACESKLSAARARIASLEKALESTAALEDLLKAGTPLHSGFMSLISSAVSNALKGFSLPDSGVDAKLSQMASDMSELGARMSALEEKFSAESRDESNEEEMGRIIATLDNTDARLKALENRVQALQEGASREMEKAAAATVARILHEEISRLAQE